MKIWDSKSRILNLNSQSREKVIRSIYSYRQVTMLTHYTHENANDAEWLGEKLGLSRPQPLPKNKFEFRAKILCTNDQIWCKNMDTQTISMSFVVNFRRVRAETSSYWQWGFARGSQHEHQNESTNDAQTVDISFDPKKWLGRQLGLLCPLPLLPSPHTKKRKLLGQNVVHKRQNWMHKHVHTEHKRLV